MEHQGWTTVVFQVLASYCPIRHGLALVNTYSCGCIYVEMEGAFVPFLRIARGSFATGSFIADIVGLDGDE